MDINDIMKAVTKKKGENLSKSLLLLMELR